jgi:hypothetical protein
MWELLTGRRLFKGESDMMTLRLVKDCQVPRPSQINPKLPPGLDEVVLRALAPTPDKRYPDCSAFRLALEDYIIQLRLPASTAHLSAFLRELYAERIAAESDPLKLDQLAEDADLDTKDKSNPSRSHSLGPGHKATPSRHSLPSLPPRTRSRQSVEALVGPAPRLENTRGTESLGRPTPPRRFPVIPVAVSGAALLVIAGAAVVYLNRKPELPPEPPPVVAIQPPQSGDPKPAQPHEPPASPLKVELLLHSEPAGAAVQLAGKPLGVTPVTLPLAPEAAPVEVTLSLEGYEPLTRQVSAANAPSLKLALERRAAPTPTTTKTHGNGKKSPTGYIKKGR